MNIIVDTREASKASKLVKALERRGVNIEKQALPYGDYFIPKEPAIIERKSVTDFVNTLKQGRLFEQLSGLKSIDAKPFLILEGRITTLRRYTKFSFESIYGLLLSIERDWGIPIVPTENMGFTSIVLYLMAKKAEESGKPTHRLVMKPKLDSLDKKARFIVESLPEISSVKAEALLKHFGSVKAIFDNIEQIDKVEGIGSKTKEEVLKVIMYKFK
jgi:ERCC4-type nuclease